MTSIAAPAPRGQNTKWFAILLLVVAFSLIMGYTLSKLAQGPMDITVKPCRTCRSCACKPILGGPRCGCPQ